jgi:Uma2 family endonuclease
MSLQSRVLTYDDLQRLRDETHDRLELIEGELFVTPSPTPFHQYVSRRINALLTESVEEAGLGLVFYAPLDVEFAPRTIVQPDLMVLLWDRVGQVGGKHVVGPPSLVVEIVSPSTEVQELIEKRDTFALHEVPEYWLVDPDAKSVTIFSDPRDGRYRQETVTSDVAISATIPGLSADLEALFAPVPGL